MPALTLANLVSYVLQVAAIVGVGAGLPSLLRVRTPRARLVYWRGLLLAGLVVPFLQMTAPPPQAMPATANPVVELRVAPTSPGPSPSAPAVTPAPSWLIGPLVGTLLAAGILGRLGWLGLGMVTLRRLRRDAPLLLPRPPAIADACRLVEADAEFRSTAAVGRPVTFGAVLPVVLVPERFASFDAGQQKAIACHELLHVRRHDWLRATADEVVRAVAWFHPAVWWLMDQIQLAREQVVDREVVRLLGSRQSYLDALLHMAVPSARPALRPASLFLRRAHLRERVALLVKEVSMSRPRLLLSFVVMSAVLFLAGRAALGAFPLQAAQGARQASAAAPQAPAAPGVIAGAARSPQSATVAAQRPSPPNVLTRVDPVYPAAAKQSGLTGIAVVEVTVDGSGLVSEARVLRGASPLAEAAVEAARQWMFAAPAQAPYVTTIGFNFPPAGASTGGLAPEAQRVGGDIPPPRKIRDVKPVYPAEAVSQGIQGVQIIEATLDDSGYVLNARALRGIEPLIVPALEAVLNWRFDVSGAPAGRLMMTVTVNFRLGPGSAGDSGVPKQAASDSPRPLPADWPANAVRIGGDIKPPLKLKDVRPVYPPEAREARVQGVVIVDALVGPDGTVQGARVLRSIPLLDQAALEAVSQWQFTPTLLNGNPIPVVVTMTINFVLE